MQEEIITIEIVQDSHPSSPREDDNVGTVVLSSRSPYRFGDIIASAEEIRDIVNNKNNIVLPVYIYDHSGITINTTGFSCPWDSGQVGIIYCSKEKAVEEWGKKSCTKKVREAALSYMNGEIEDLDQFLTGDIYGYVLKDKEGETVDSCFGFYGHETAMQEAKSAKEYYVNNS